MFQQTKALCFAALLFLSGAAQAAWHTIDAAPIRIVSELSPKQSQKILRDLDVYQVTVAQLLPNVNTRFKVPMTILVLSPKSWQRYVSGGQGRAGFVFTRPGRVHMVIDGSAWTRDAPVLFHELSHVILHQNSGGRELPTWYDEGYAELLSTIRSSGGDKVKVGGVPVWRWVSLQSNPWMPLQTLLGVSHDSPEYEKERLANSFYAGSWLIMHYVTFGDNRQRGRQIEQYRSYLSDGLKQEEAFAKAFPDDNGAFEKELRAYSKRTSFMLAELKVSLPDTAQREAVKITDAEAFGAIADFKLATARTDDNDLALFQQWAAGAAPDAVPTLRLGALHALRNEREAAMSIADAGCTVRSASYDVAKACGLLYYQAAFEKLPCRCEELMDLARQSRYHFARVLDETPDDVESLLYAGTASIWAQRADDLARDGLVRAWRDRKIRDDEIAYALAYLYARDDYATAKQYLELALMYATGYQRQQQLAREINNWSSHAPKE
ncbi:hypothetical protein ACFPN2_08170 [Steroidobacter flavus]|uniref:DUF1570 domain-containing protein n=1 Tax=Steroidobacter flavus TaxID=1842136 RepID=A0ABV8SNJ7_9GAMM